MKFGSEPLEGRQSVGIQHQAAPGLAATATMARVAAVHAEGRPHHQGIEPLVLRMA